MCMHLTLKTARVQWCLLAHKYPSAGALTGRTGEELGKLDLWWAWTIFLRWGGGGEAVREHPSLLQHLVWKQGEAVLEPTRLCFPCFNVFHWSSRSRNPIRCFKAKPETKLKASHSCASLYCLFRHSSCVKFDSRDSVFLGMSLFSGSRLWRLSSKFSSTGWGTLFNVSNIIFNDVMNCFLSYNFAWINIFNRSLWILLT